MYPTSWATTPVELISLTSSQPNSGTRKRKRTSGSTISRQPAPTLRNVGLQTPPADEMSDGYPSRRPSIEHAALINPGRHSENAAATNFYANPSTFFHPYSEFNLPPLQYLTQFQSHEASPSRLRQAPSTKSDAAVVVRNQSSGAEGHNRRNNRPTVTAPATEDDSVPLSSILPIPRSICDSGGSLPEFAAQMTCLFWFESIETLNEAEGGGPPPMGRCLRPEALPTSAFCKWVENILATTQVSDKVIILALLFIYRLKKYNSSVRGQTGSEYRLLTVALMLANKFLDDNTYANNTWAEASGIAVKEIHIMEVEFLSNMRYSLLASKKQWENWHKKLRNFKFFCDVASRTFSSYRSLRPIPSPPESTYASSPPSLNYYAQIAPPSTLQWLTPPSLPSSMTTGGSAPSLPLPMNAMSSGTTSLNHTISTPSIPSSMNYISSGPSLTSSMNYISSGPSLPSYMNYISGAPPYSPPPNPRHPFKFSDNLFSYDYLHKNT